MTYARARLWLGIGGVGLLVVLASFALLWEWPTLLFANWGATWSQQLLGLSLVVGAYTLLHIPLDYIGGYWLPCYFSRQCLLFNFFAAQYLRAALLHGLFLLLSSFFVLLAGQYGGRPASLLVIACLMVLQVEGQDWIASILAGLRREKKDGVVYLSGLDTGLSVMPRLWDRILPSDALELALFRRGAAKIARLRGLALAISFNLLGFWACSYLPNAGVETLSQLLTTSLGFTLWSFLGLLILPTPSREGVFELDRAARIQGFPPDRFEAVVRELDQLSDDEPNRALGIEAIFHPVPSVERRLQKYKQASISVGAWNAARYALYLSWPCLGFLNRAVHCNSGRPELWAMLPVD
jgi:hypothetical protein